MMPCTISRLIRWSGNRTQNSGKKRTADISFSGRVREPLIQHSKCPKPVLLTVKNHQKFIDEETEAVIFVREPLERLLAGYQMIFNHPNVTKQNYDLFIRPILNKVRFEGKSVMPKSPVEAWEKTRFH